MKKLEGEVIRRITTGQVIQTLSNVVKELIDNSLDAGATSIEVKLVNYGIDCIVVSDNGSGISYENLKYLGQKSYTTKIESFEDIEELNTFGFRGEALNALATISKLTIITRWKKSDKRTGFKCEVNGRKENENITGISRNIGTTVQVKEIFYNLPVRRKDLMIHKKREFSRLVQLLYSTCFQISFCSDSSSSSIIRLNVNNHLSTSSNSILNVDIKRLSTLSLTNEERMKHIEDNFRKIFKSNKSMIHFKLIDRYCSHCFKNVEERESHPFNFYGIISSIEPGCGEKSTQHQYLYINGRPTNQLIIQNLIQTIYRQANVYQHPIFIVNIIVENLKYLDLNVSSDKRLIYVNDERYLCSLIRHSLLETFQRHPVQLPTNNHERRTNLNDTVNSSFNNDSTLLDISLINSNSKRTISPQSSNLSKTHQDNAGKKTETHSFFDLSKYLTTKEESRKRHLPENDLSLTNNENEKVRVKTEFQSPSLHESFSQITNVSLISPDHDLHRYDHSSKRFKESTPENVCSNRKINFFQKDDSNKTIPKEIESETMKTVPKFSSANNVSKSLFNNYHSTSDDQTKNNSIPIDSSEKEINERNFLENVLGNSKKNFSNSLTETDVFGDKTPNSQSPPSSFSENGEEINGKPNETFVNINVSYLDTDSETQFETILRKAEILKVKNPLRQMERRKLFEKKRKKLRNHLLDGGKWMLLGNGYHLTEKSIFRKFKIIGQFNKGFIITQYFHQLYIVDQHASDEIARFEYMMNSCMKNIDNLSQPDNNKKKKLWREMKKELNHHIGMYRSDFSSITPSVTIQMLLKPMKIEVESSIQKTVLMEYRHLFEELGCGFDEITTKTGNKCLYLVSIPTVDNIWKMEHVDIIDLLQQLCEIFNPSTFNDNNSLVSFDNRKTQNQSIYSNNKSQILNESILSDNSFSFNSIPIANSTIKEDNDHLLSYLEHSSDDKEEKVRKLIRLRPNRLRSALASKSCRTAIMVGDVLSLKKQMSIVSHLADMMRPWNCPHGRPTYQHLYSLEHSH